MRYLFLPSVSATVGWLDLGILMMRLRLLGSTDLRTSEGEEIRSVLAQPKRLALLAYLACTSPSGFQRRDELVGLFWPEMLQERARASLRQSLYFLRKSLGTPMVVETRGSEEVGLRAGTIWCDVVAFEQAVRQEIWNQALRLYRGHFLAGFHVSGAPGFEHWLELERERLRETAAGSAWSLAKQHVDEGRVLRAERTAQRALLLAPTDESPVRFFIQALADAGDRAAALQFYERFADLIAEELDVEPAPETTEVAEDIRARKIKPRIVPPSEPDDRGRRERITRQRGSPEEHDGPASADLSSDLASTVGSHAPERPTPGGRFQRLKAKAPRWTTGLIVLALLVAGGFIAASLGLHEHSEAVSATLGLSEDDWLIAADFQGPEDQPELAAAFASLVIADVEASGYVGVRGGLGTVSRMQLQSALERARVPKDTVLDAGLAVELGRREGAAGVLTGQILPLGDVFVLRLEILSLPEGKTAVTLTDEADLTHLASVARSMSHSLRRRLGESQASIHGSPPLPEVTTRSLEALRVYQKALDHSRGVEARHDVSKTEAFLEKAVELDPDFATAHAHLASIYLVRGAREKANEHCTRAYELRSELPRRERLFIEALHQRTVESDPRKAVATWEEMAREFPDTRRFVLRYIEVCLSWYGDWEGVMALSRETCRERPAFRFGPWNGWIAAWELGKPAVADSFLARYHELTPNELRIHLLHRVHQRDWSGSEELCRNHPRSYYCALFYLMRGKAEKAVEQLSWSAAAGRDRSVELAAAEWLRGDREAALTWIRRNGAIHEDSLALPRFHVRRFRRCGLGVLMGVEDLTPACCLESEDPASWDRAGSHLGVRHAGAWSWRLLAVRALSVGNVTEGLQAARTAVRRCFDTPSPWDDLIRGWAWELQEQPDSAIVAYRAAIRPGRLVPSGLLPVFLGPVYRRIGELEEAAGDLRAAREAYGAFAALWADADSELQPQVRDVQDKLDHLPGSDALE
jgi:DNA-binding SARP family transcriptional activator